LLAGRNAPQAGKQIKHFSDGQKVRQIVILRAKAQPYIHAALAGRDVIAVDKRVAVSGQYFTGQHLKRCRFASAI